MTRVVITGPNGFVGSAASHALRTGGAQVIPMRVPRLETTSHTASAIQMEAASSTILGRLADAMRGADVVLNCAGMAEPDSRSVRELYGANALLPVILAYAARQARVGRFVHISSAAVQGRRKTLDESQEYQPLSPYAQSKTLAELAIPHGADITILRPTSVHGPNRQTTRRLVQLATSPLAFVAGDGTAPTPQAHIANVGAATAHLSLTKSPPPRVVVQPSEGWTTASILTALGGRQPRLVNSLVCQAAARAAGLGSGLLAKPGLSRRVELLLFGQHQSGSWLEGDGFVAPTQHRDWQALRKFAEQ